MTIADINILARFLCDADTSSYTAANLLITINQAYERVVSKLLLADGRWQFDDNNFTTFPIATTTLVNSQPDYTFDNTYLRILRVEVMDKDGNYYLIDPIDLHDIGGIATTEYFETDGRPIYYDKQGASLVLYPAPDNGVSVTLASGLKVYFQRTADVFTSAQVTIGTKQPGFASPFHHILAYMAAVPYCIKYKPERLPAIYKEITDVMGDEATGRQGSLERFYSKRQKDERPIMTMKSISFR